MTTPIRPAATALGLAAGAASTAAEAAQLQRGATQAGVLNLRRLGCDIANVAEHSPRRAGDLLEEIKPQVSSAEGKALSREVAQSLDEQAEQQKGAMGRKAGLVLDMAQLALSIAGIFDPTPTCDAIDGVISLLRRDYTGAAISAVSMVPYLGDAAKLAKLGKLANVVDEAMQLARVDPGFASEIAAHVDKARSALGSIAADFVPAPRLALARGMERALDGFASTKAAGALPATAGPAPLAFIPPHLLNHARGVTEREFIRTMDRLLERFGLTRIKDHPVHSVLWQQAHDMVTGPTKANAYSRAFTKFDAGIELTRADRPRPAFDTINAKFRELFEAHYGYRPGPVEHLENLAHRPGRAIDPSNLAVTSHVPELGTTQHELLHWIKSGGDTHGDRRAWFIQVYSALRERFGGDPALYRPVRQSITVEIPADRNAPVTTRRSGS